MPVELRCQCGQRVTAGDHQGGKRYPCPKCGRPIVVPAQTPATLDNAPRTFAEPILAPPSRTAPIEGFSQAERGYPTTTGIGQVILVYFVLWGLLFVVSLAVMAFLPFLRWVALALLLLISGVLLAHSVVLLTAKSRVIRYGDQPLLFGLLKLVAWNPTQGIVILRTKSCTTSTKTCTMAAASS